MSFAERLAFQWGSRFEQIPLSLDHVFQLTTFDDRSATS